MSSLPHPSDVPQALSFEAARHSVRLYAKQLADGEIDLDEWCRRVQSAIYVFQRTEDAGRA